jgi:hypothetical protein
MQCRSCGVELSEAAAGASIFALSFLPVAGHKVRRERAISIAEKVGPLCLRCLKDCKELPDDGGDDVPLPEQPAVGGECPPPSNYTR